MSAKTVTVVAAFADEFQARLRAVDSDAVAGLHVSEVADAAKWAGEWLAGGEGDPLGFTVSPSWGGGAGWDVEAGCTFVFAGVDPSRVLDVLQFARALRGRERQQAVVFLVRDESFTLVD